MRAGLSHEVDMIHHDYDVGSECGDLLRAINEAGGEPGALADNIAGNILVSFLMMQALGGGYEPLMQAACDDAKTLLGILPAEFEHGRVHIQNMIGILSDHLAKQTKH